jgi:hypothetical protein
MKKLTIAAVVTAMALVAIAPAQNDSSTIVSGPWMMRKSTGDKTVDRMYYIMDRTLNAAEADTMRTMFRNMGGYTSYTMQKAIINAIDNYAKNNPGYASWSSGSWTNPAGATDVDIYYAMDNGLSWQEKGVLHTWEANASPSEMTAVAKLVRWGGWANNMWTTSGMG